MFVGINEREVVYHSENVKIIRGTMQGDGTRVIVKALPVKPSSSAPLARLRYEYDMLAKVATARAPQIPRPLQLLDTAGQIGLVIEDIGGVSLHDHTTAQRLSLDDVLHVGEEVAKALQVVHAARLVHKDVNPNNIIWNKQSGAVQLVDFGIATQLRRELQSSDSLRSLDGTPAYMAPEQTGRTGFPLDYRADFYSLGVTFYQLLANRLPFQQEDLAELVYAILAATPPDLAMLRPSLPACFVAVVNKLMAKSPDDRYQSVHGLLHDLSQCRAVLAGTGTFALAQADRLERFDIPQKLYGREREVAILHSAYRGCREQQNVSVTLIDGVSGIGKSSLLQQLRPEVLKDKGLFISGKHDQLRRHVPFSAFAQAISDWVQDVLKEPEAVRATWERRIRGALGNVGQALLQIAPSLELLVGKQKPIPELGPRESENRLLTLLHRFVQALCKDAPLVLFLDDLQWADSGTLKLLTVLSEVPLAGAGLLIVGAYRSNEVNDAHPLAMAIGEIRKLGVAICGVRVQALTTSDVSAMLADATHASPEELEEVAALAQTLTDKTAGNPFFLHELLSHLWDTQLIRYDATRGKFSWQLRTIATAAVPDTAVGLMTQKLEALPTAERDMVSLAACLGDKFTLDLLAHAAEVSRPVAAERLEPALQAGLLIPLDGAYRYARLTEDEVSYKFAHDRVQQAAYALLPAQVAQQRHLAIGRLMRPRMDADTNITVFAVLEHMNNAVPLITDARERQDIIELNIRAGREAKRAAAYPIALGYLRMAQDLSSAAVDRRDVDVYRRVGSEMAEVEFLTGNTEAALTRLDDIIAATGPGLDKAELHALRATILDGMARHKEALAACIAGLAAIDSPINLNSPAQLIGTLLAVLWRTRRVDEIFTAPECTDRRVLMTMRLLGVAASPAFSAAGPVMFVAVCANSAWLSMKHGRGPFSAFAFAALCVAFSNMQLRKLSRTYARCAMRLAQDTNTAAPAGVRLCAYHWALYVDLTPAGCLKISEEGFVAGRDSGDVVYGAWHAATITGMQQRMSLSSIDHTSPLYWPSVRASSVVAVFWHGQEQAARCLRGQTESPSSLTSPEFSESDFEEYLRTHADHDPGSTGVRYYHLMAACIHGDFAQAARWAMGLYDIKGLEATTLYVGHQIAYFGGVALLREAERLGRLGRRERAFLRTLRGLLAGLAETSPQCRGDWLLLEAEIAAFKGKYERAAAMFDEACALQASVGWLDLVAFGLECAGRFHARRDNRTTASLYLRRAREAYAAWGATVKVGMLEAELRASAPEQATMSVTSTTGSLQQTSASHATRATSSIGPRATSSRSSTGLLGELELAAMMRVAQAIASETQSSKVVSEALAGLLRAGGATRVVLMLADDGNLTLAGDTAEDRPGLPYELLQVAARTKRRLIDLSSLEIDDPYLRVTNAKALACVPLLNRGALLGVVYMENTLTANAFTTDRMRVVELLASQAAVALSNAQNLALMEQQVAKRTQAAREAQERLLRVEKENIETQMAGGFAHEMRNSLSAARWPLAALYPTDSKATGPTFFRVVADTLSAVQRVGEGLGGDISVPAAKQELASLVQNGRTEQALAQEMFEAAKESVDRGLAITHEILAYAQAGYLSTGDETAAITPVVTGVLRELASRIKSAGVVVQADLPEQLQVPMREEHVHVILRNLLINACDAVDMREGENKSVRITGEVHARELRLSVEDNGVGMSDATQRKIFQPFFTTKGANGVGLGLGLSRKLAELYGGRLQFTTELNRGTTFELTIPLAHGSVTEDENGGAHA